MRLRNQHLILAIFLFLISCEPGNLDSGLFSGKPCKAPCWQNLTPGQSTADHVDRFINNLSATEWPGRRSLFYPPNCTAKIVSDKIGTVVDARVSFQIENDKLTFIESNPTNAPTLGEIVNSVGPPEYFEAVSVGGDAGISYFVEIYYPARGLGFIVAPNQEANGYVRPDTKVMTIEYFAPGNLLSYFTTRYSCFVGQAKAIADAQREIADRVQLWSGFGAVKVTP